MLSFNAKAVFYKTKIRILKGTATLLPFPKPTLFSGPGSSLDLCDAIAQMGTRRLLIVTDPAPYKLLLAAIILVYLNVNRIGMNLGWVRNRPTIAFAVFGTLGGMLAGTVNVMVPVLIIWALEMGLQTTAMVQVFNFCFFFGKISQAIVLAGAGVLTGPIVISTVPLAGAALGAVFVGMALRSRVDQETYKAWLRKALYIIAGLLIAQYFSADL